MVAQRVIAASDDNTVRTPGRRNPRWIAGGIIAICVGGLGSAMLYSTVADTHTVVLVNKGLARGQTIQAGDVQTITVGSLESADIVQGDEVDVVIGQRVKTDVAPGSFLPRQALGENPFPADHARVGVRLTVGRMPVAPLTPGTPITVVEAGATNAVVSGDEPAGSVNAIVVSDPHTLADGSSAFDIAVPKASAEHVARLSATGSLAIISWGDR